MSARDSEKLTSAAACLARRRANFPEGMWRRRHTSQVKNKVRAQREAAHITIRWPWSRFERRRPPAGGHRRAASLTQFY